MDEVRLYVGMEISQSANVSIAASQQTFTDELQLMITSLDLWQKRRRLLTPEKVSPRRRKLGQ